MTKKHDKNFRCFFLFRLILRLQSFRFLMIGFIFALTHRLFKVSSGNQRRSNVRIRQILA